MSFTRVIVFDLDDTLYLERDFVRNGYHAVSLALEDQGLLDPGQTAFSGQWMWDRFQTGQSENMFNALSENFSLNLDNEKIAELVSVYRFHQPMIELLDGIEELLDALGRQKQTGLSLISDGPLQMQQNKFSALGLGEWISRPIFTAALGKEAGKPSPQAFEKVMADFPSVSASEIIYVADNLTKDFIAPNQLGWRSICVRWDRQVHAHKPAAANGQPQLTVKTVEELRDALAV